MMKPKATRRQRRREGEAPAALPTEGATLAPIMKLAIGIDLGGTNLKGALVDEAGEVLHRTHEPSRAERAPKEMLADLVETVRRLEQAAGTEVASVGFGVPGIVDQEKGVVFKSPHFPTWKEYPIAKNLEKKLGRKIFIDNDANCVVRGEAWQGAGREKDHLICLTLGTGIGGGIILDGKVLRGERGFAGEVGHIIVEAQGVPCPCGSHGCFEMYASGTALKRMSREMGEERTPADLYGAVEQGDATARELFEHFGYYLGVGIASLVNVLGVHTVALGGGVSQAWDYFIEATRKEFSRRTYEETARVTEIVRAELGDDAGIIGAAYGALNLS